MKPLLKPLIILTLVVVASHAWFTTVDWQGVHANIDLKHYRTMAAQAPGVLTLGEAPFCYRILPTWLAGVAGKGLGDELWGFRIVSALAVLFASLMLFTYLASKGVNETTALTMAILAVISQHVLGGVVFNPFQTCDALAIALMLVMLIAVERANIGGFVIASIAGALTREPCMLMVPVALTYVVWRVMTRDRSDGGKWTDRSAIWKWTAACVPAVVAFVAVRIVVHAANTDWSIGAMLVENAYKFSDGETWARLVVFAAAPISLIPFYFFKQTRTVLADNPHLVVLLVFVVASSFLGGDTERLVAPAMVVYYLITARVLDQRPSPIVNGFLFIAALVCSMHPVFVRWSPFGNSATHGSDAVSGYYLTAAITIALTLLVVVFTRTGFRKEHR